MTLHSLQRNPAHILMPSLIELEDAGVTDVGRWKPANCPVCYGSRRFIGYLPNSSSEFMEFSCECEEQLVLRRWFAVRGITPIAMQTRWADLTSVPKEHLDAIDTFLGPDCSMVTSNLRVGKGFLLHGQSGSGKSSLAWLLMKTVLYSPLHTAFATSGSLITTQLLKWRSDPDHLERWNRRMVNSDLLVIDDLGQLDSSKDFVRNSVERILIQRCESRRSTVITTNKSENELSQIYPTAMAITRSSGQSVLMSLTESFRDDSLRKRNDIESANNVARPAVWS